MERWRRNIGLKFPEKGRRIYGRYPKCKSSPLKNITSNYHYHKVSADSEETLDLIEQELREKGFLVEERRQAV